LRIKEQETHLTLQEHDDDDIPVLKIKVEQSRYRPGVTQRVAGS